MRSMADTKKPIIPDMLTEQPTRFWEKAKVKQRVDKVEKMKLDTSVADDKVRFVCMSDTHNKTENMSFSLPPGDVYLHGGDFTKVGQVGEVLHFSQFLDSLPYKYKVVIAGNHDLCFDPQFLVGENSFGFPQPKKILEDFEKVGVTKASEILKDKCIYLEDSGISLFGIKIWGSPWQPWFHSWGFNLKRGQPCLDKWNLIPDDTDILITHGPPIGHGDMCFDQQRAGCVELLTTVQQRVKPRAHVFGHIHEGYGITTDGVTNYYNASTCTLRYQATQEPLIFDIPLPDGHSKDDLPELFTGLLQSSCSM